MLKTTVPEVLRRQNTIRIFAGVTSFVFLVQTLGLRALGFEYLAPPLSTTKVPFSVSPTERPHRFGKREFIKKVVAASVWAKLIEHPRKAEEAPIPPNQQRAPASRRPQEPIAGLKQVVNAYYQTMEKLFLQLEKESASVKRILFLKQQIEKEGSNVIEALKGSVAKSLGIDTTLADDEAFLNTLSSTLNQWMNPRQGDGRGYYFMASHESFTFTYPIEGRLENITVSLPSFLLAKRVQMPDQSFQWDSIPQAKDRPPQEIAIREKEIPLLSAALGELNFSVKGSPGEIVYDLEGLTTVADYLQQNWREMGNLPDLVMSEQNITDLIVKGSWETAITLVRMKLQKEAWDKAIASGEISLFLPTFLKDLRAYLGIYQWRIPHDSGQTEVEQYLRAFLASLAYSNKTSLALILLIDLGIVPETTAQKAVIQLLSLFSNFVKNHPEKRYPPLDYQEKYKNQSEETRLYHGLTQLVMCLQRDQIQEITRALYQERTKAPSSSSSDENDRHFGFVSFIGLTNSAGIAEFLSQEPRLWYLPFTGFFLGFISYSLAHLFDKGFSEKKLTPQNYVVAKVISSLPLFFLISASFFIHELLPEVPAQYAIGLLLSGAVGGVVFSGILTRFLSHLASGSNKVNSPIVKKEPDAQQQKIRRQEIHITLHRLTEFSDVDLDQLTRLIEEVKSWYRSIEKKLGRHGRYHLKNFITSLVRYQRSLQRYIEYKKQLTSSNVVTQQEIRLLEARLANVGKTISAIVNHPQVTQETRSQMVLFHQRFRDLHRRTHTKEEIALLEGL